MKAQIRVRHAYCRGSFHCRALAWCLTVSLVGVAPTLLAQATAPKKPVKELKTITVTATYQKEPLAKVPESVAVF
ncbi:MAG: hypothetical protein EPN40_01375, partial [Rhodanobacteraceae bacterium]